MNPLHEPETHPPQASMGCYFPIILTGCSCAGETMGMLSCLFMAFLFALSSDIKKLNLTTGLFIAVWGLGCIGAAIHDLNMIFFILSLLILGAIASFFLWFDLGKHVLFSLFVGIFSLWAISEGVDLPKGEAPAIVMMFLFGKMVWNVIQFLKEFGDEFWGGLSLYTALCIFSFIPANDSDFLISYALMCTFLGSFVILELRKKSDFTKSALLACCSALLLFTISAEVDDIM